MLYALTIVAVVTVAIIVLDMPWPLAILCAALGVGCGMVAGR